jgi:hypothetical protein
MQDFYLDCFVQGVFLHSTFTYPVIRRITLYTVNPEISDKAVNE